MARLLYIEASPRKDRSASIEVAKAFIEAYTASHQGDVIDTIDLWKTDLPPFDGDTVNANPSSAVRKHELNKFNQLHF